MIACGPDSDFRGDGIPTSGPASGPIRDGWDEGGGVRFPQRLWFPGQHWMAAASAGNRAGTAIETIGIDTIGIDTMARVSLFKFMQEVRQEVAKVTWPSRRETTITTIMVFVFATVAGVFFLLADQLIRMTVTMLLGIGSS
jgi:preprotein translocase subunit SecE